MLSHFSCADFDPDPKKAYLNQARLGMLPRRSQNAIHDYAQQMRWPTPAFMQQAFEQEQALRGRLAAWINAETETMALLKNTSEGLSIIAKGLDWQEQDEIVFAKQEFPSNQMAWEHTNASCVEVDLYSTELPEQALMQACNEHTRLLSVSAVQFADGLKLDLAVLGAFCQSRNILFCVDAAQALGAYPIDVKAWHIDFMVACTHKWLLGPEGMGVFYVRKTLLAQLQLQQFGWYQLQSLQRQKEGWSMWQDARRFQCGSPNTMGVAVLSASLSLLEELGQQAIAQAIDERVGYLSARLEAIGATLISPEKLAYRAGILSFYLDDVDTAILCQALNQQHIICSERQGAIRFAPHFYITEEQLKRAMDVLTATLPLPK